MSQPSKTISIVASILLFFIALASEQIYDVIILYATIPTWFYQVLFLLIPCISLIAFGLFIRVTRSSFKRQGYKKPAGINTSKCLLLSIFFVLLYLSIILSQTFFGNLGSLNLPSSPYSLMFRIAIAAVYGLFSESVFRGYIFRNLARNYGLFTSLYASSILFSLHKISIREIPTITDDVVIYIFTRIIPLLAAGLFLGFLFYKTRWSLLGPLTFRIGFLFFFEPSPIISASSPWWIALTFEILAFTVLILLVDSIIQEPRYRRKRYGLED
jgi:membrane protease YdiL (CAAX protease family)